jgi:putative ABC transport system substrate-binding protein
LIGFLDDPTPFPFSRSAKVELNNAQIAALALGVRLVIANATTPGEIEKALAIFLEQHVDAFVTANRALFYLQASQLAASAARHAIPAIYPLREFVDAGGLMSYGGDVSDAAHIVGSYVGRILKGEKPADLPVQQATKLELAINLKTAKALGLSIPETLLATADEVIQ